MEPLASSETGRRDNRAVMESRRIQSQLDQLESGAPGERVIGLLMTGLHRNGPAWDHPRLHAAAAPLMAELRRMGLVEAYLNDAGTARHRITGGDDSLRALPDLVNRCLEIWAPESPRIAMNWASAPRQGPVAPAPSQLLAEQWPEVLGLMLESGDIERPERPQEKLERLQGPPQIGGFYASTGEELSAPHVFASQGELLSWVLNQKPVRGDAEVEVREPYSLYAKRWKCSSLLLPSGEHLLPQGLNCWEMLKLAASGIGAPVQAENVGDLRNHDWETLESLVRKPGFTRLPHPGAFQETTEKMQAERETWEALREAGLIRMMKTPGGVICRISYSDAGLELLKVSSPMVYLCEIAPFWTGAVLAASAPLPPATWINKVSAAVAAEDRDMNQDEDFSEEVEESESVGI